MLFWALSSLLAGVLTALSPCVLPLLPGIFTKKLAEGSSKLGALFAGLLSSIILLTLLILTPKAFFSFPVEAIRYLSATLLAFLALMMLLPHIWTQVMLAMGKGQVERQILSIKPSTQLWSDYLLGFALGFSFTSCSPTYFAIMGIIFPENFLLGSLYFGFFLMGFLGVLFLLLALVFKGVKINRLSFLKRQKKLFACFMLFLALSMAMAWDKAIVAYLLQSLSIFNHIL